MKRNWVSLKEKKDANDKKMQMTKRSEGQQVASFLKKGGVNPRVANSGGLAGFWRFGTFVWREKILGAGRF